MYYINDLTPEELSETIRIALADTEIGVEARKRIIRKFPLEKRRKKILNVLDGLSSSTHNLPRRHDFAGSR